MRAMIAAPSEYSSSRASRVDFIITPMPQVTTTSSTPVMARPTPREGHSWAEAGQRVRHKNMGLITRIYEENAIL